MTPRPQHETRYLGGVSLVCLLLATAYQLLCAFRDVPFLNQYVLRMDDAYYYFQVARNVADKGRVTFDGLHATSGLQVLWGLILTGIALVIHGRLAFLQGILALSAALDCTAGFMLRSLGRKVYSADAGNVAAILWSGYMVGLSPTMIGVEYPLHIVVIIGLLSVLWTILLAPREVTSGRLHALGLLLTLNYWTRLDSASLSLMVALSVSVVLVTTAPTWRAGLKRIATLGAWPAAGAVGYAAICLAVAGTPMPISGLVKAFYAGQHFVQRDWLTSLAAHVDWWLQVLMRPIIDATSDVWLANHKAILRPVPDAILIGWLALTVWTAVQVFRERHDDVRQFRAMTFLGVLWAFEAVHAAIVVETIGPFAHVTQHYYGWLFVTWCLWAGLMMQRLLARGPSGSWPRTGALAVVVCVIAGNAVLAWGTYTAPPDMTVTLNNRRLPVIAWINANLPADTRLAAWNAGQIGYFCDRTVVNLDGLANDEEYYTGLKKHMSITEYLRREEIGYLVDNNAPDLTMPFEATWDRSAFFHRTEPWSALETVYEEAGQDNPILVLHVRGVPPFPPEHLSANVRPGAGI